MIARKVKAPPKPRPSIIPIVAKYMTVVLCLCIAGAALAEPTAAPTVPLQTQVSGVVDAAEAQSIPL
ncbi:hypothetical protein ACX9MO_18650 [Pseudooceanicola sp. 502str34]|uniref:hypothetical protein n=1 Tax=Maritimibacter alkaliphilus TaxID=404236 RepID=UPI001C96B16B|nr:hypothetical protein [Maritimibacter alkaliphilus]MBY6089830.1 hypothetical protein [Maritimibacter alkaliphilus]